jgi:hypothetical protein
MTDAMPINNEPLIVTQADRDAADAHRLGTFTPGVGSDLAKAFAAHRIKATSEAIERAAEELRDRAENALAKPCPVDWPEQNWFHRQRGIASALHSAEAAIRSLSIPGGEG